jgi:diguanylate cyclase (GGDEF)-like protein
MRQTPPPVRKEQLELLAAFALLVVSAAALAAAGGGGRAFEIGLIGGAAAAAYVLERKWAPVLAGGLAGLLFLVEATIGHLGARHLLGMVLLMGAAAGVVLLAGRLRAARPGEGGGTRRRPLPGSLEYELQRSLRHARAFSVLVARPDGPAGEELVEQVTRVLTTQLRGTDAISSRGGEEFWLILPETAGEAARAVGERIRLALGPTVAMSVGISSFPEDGISASDLAAAAERALRGAIELGGNRTILHSVRGDTPSRWGLTSVDA